MSYGFMNLLLTSESPSSFLVVWIYTVMTYLAMGIGVIGGVVIVWGVLCGLLKWGYLELANFQGRDTQILQEGLRHHLGYYLLLGLEFLVAADIIETLMAPTLEHLAILGGIVVIRMMISYSLQWELSHQSKKT